MTLQSDNCKIEKKALRKKMCALLSSLNPISKAFESTELCLNFIQSEIYKCARVIFGFMPLKDEVDVLPILRAAIADGKKVLLPKIASKIKPDFDADFSGGEIKNSAGKIGIGEMDFYFIESDPIEETEEGSHGIFEPKTSCEKADTEKLFMEMRGEEIVVLVPALAFTEEGFRLGRGGGYYDRFLERISRICGASENEKGFKTKPRLLGVCYGMQVLESVPCEAHDAQVDCILGI